MLQCENSLWLFLFTIQIHSCYPSVSFIPRVHSGTSKMALAINITTFVAEEQYVKDILKSIKNQVTLFFTYI